MLVIHMVMFEITFRCISLQYHVKSRKPSVQINEQINQNISQPSHQSASDRANATTDSPIRRLEKHNLSTNQIANQHISQLLDQSES